MLALCAFFLYPSFFSLCALKLMTYELSVAVALSGAFELDFGVNYENATFYARQVC